MRFILKVPFSNRTAFSAAPFVWGPYGTEPSLLADPTPAVFEAVNAASMTWSSAGSLSLLVMMLACPGQSTSRVICSMA